MKPLGDFICSAALPLSHPDMRHPNELLLKEAIHIHMIPVQERLNRDTRLELPGCWVATLRRQESRTNRTPTDGFPTNPTNTGDNE